MHVLINDQHHERVSAFCADHAPGEEDWQQFLILAHLIERGEADANGAGLTRAKDLVREGRYPQGFEGSDTLALKAMALWFDYRAA